MERGCIGSPAARSGRLLALALVMIVILLMPVADGVEMTGLYTVEVPIDRSASNAQNAAYRAALTEVLIRVTGTTAVVESEQMATLFPNPAQFVSRYRPGPDGTLIVSLERDAIERVLRQAGAPVWGTDRPLTLVWLAVDWGLGEREIVGADDPERRPGDARSIDRNQLLRERIQDVAGRRGLPVAFPLLDIEDMTNVSFSDVWGGFDDPVLFASARYAATSVLVGRIRPDDLEPPHWTWYFGGQRLDWVGVAEDVVGTLADSLAAEFVIDPNQSIDSIRLTISGINSVVAYGRLQQFMENLRVIDKLMVNTVTADKIIYEVEVQGGVDRLSNALASSGLLEPVQSGAIDASLYRLNRRPFGADIRQPTVPGALDYRYRSQDD
jgi:hypothetical protein